MTVKWEVCVDICEEAGRCLFSTPGAPGATKPGFPWAPISRYSIALWGAGAHAPGVFSRVRRAGLVPCLGGARAESRALPAAQAAVVARLLQE